MLLLALLVGMTLPALAPSDAWAQDKGKKSKKAKDDKADKEEKAAGEEEGEAAAEGAEGSDATESSSASSLQRGRRMEFDARLIRGERASGAVFLFQRATRPLPSMVKRRTSYLDDTVVETLGEPSAEEFRKNQSEALAKRIKEEEEERRKAREESIKKAEKIEKEKAEREKAEKEKAAKEKSDKK